MKKKETQTQRGYEINLHQPQMRKMVFRDLKRRWDEMNEFEQTEICQTFINNYGLSDKFEEGEKD